MAYKIIDKQYCAFADDYRYEYVVDSDDDIASLPKACVGSTAIVAAENGNIYMTNTSGEWRKL